MQGIVQKLIDAVDTDNDSDEPPEPSTDMISIPIRDLFDFTQSYWVEAYGKLAMQGLQDELELYELLDLDCNGHYNRTPDLGKYGTWWNVSGT